MARDSVRASQDPVARPLDWQGLLYWSVSVLAAILAWLTLTARVQRLSFTQPAGLLRWGGLLSLLCLHALLTFAAGRSLAYTSLRHAWRSRFAVLVSGGLAFAHGLVLLLPAYSPLLMRYFLVDLPIAFAGAFLGGLLATGIEEGLWENNSPPPEITQEEVHRMHLAVIGSPPPAPFFKRLFDGLLAFSGLVFFAPVWILSVILIWFEEPGPVLFVKNSVGRGGENFRQFKFRTMVLGAETQTGPVLSREGDERVLTFGRFLRKTALDELPQLVNILCGQMSFVGPRPQRTVLVHGYLQDIPEYAERHRVLPGLAGLAQVAGDYYLTPRQKLRFDRLYIRYMSLGFDLKLLALAFLITFVYRWKKGWSGRLPPHLLRLGGSGRLRRL